ncbi:hypothetical protein Ndes2526B_g00537 [Nannochloris sp. 'desiccata']
MQNGGGSGVPSGQNGAQTHIHNGLVTVKLNDIADLARCPVCRGILKDTRTISVCMHRFCRTCIEAWLRTNIDNTCPQCRVSFASRRNCKPDPTFDQLLKAIFGADTSITDDAFLKPPSEVLAAAKIIGTDLELLREAQRLSAIKAGNNQATQQDYGWDITANRLPDASVAHPAAMHVDIDIAAAPVAAAAAAATSGPRNGLNGQQQHDDDNEGFIDTNPQLKGKAKYKRPASAPAHGAVNGIGKDGGDGNNKKIKINNTKQLGSAPGMYSEPGEGTDQGYTFPEDNIDQEKSTPNATTQGVTTTTTAATTTAAAAAVPHFRSPSKGPGTPSSKYFGVRKYYPLGPGTQPWYLAYSQEGGTTPSTSHYIKLGQFSSEEEAARIHDVHTLRIKGINPKKLSSSGSNLNFPYLSTIYVRLLAHGIAPGATSSEYEAASSKINTAVHGVGAPPGWHPPLEKNENSASNKGGGRGGGANGSRPPTGASIGSGGGGGGGGAGVNKGGAGMHKNKKMKSSSPAAAAAAGVVPNYQGVHVANRNQHYGELCQKDGDTQGGGDALEEEVDVAALRAEELAKQFSFSSMLGPSSGFPTAVVIELKPVDGLSLSYTCKMIWLTCPGDTLISAIAMFIAEGINTVTKTQVIDNYEDDGGGGGAVTKKEEMDIDTSNTVSASSIYLNAVNELDASADFMSVYKEIEGSGGLLALTPTMRIRDLVLLLADCGEDLVLEYSIQ